MAANLASFKRASRFFSRFDSRSSTKLIAFKKIRSSKRNKSHFSPCAWALTRALDEFPLNRHRVRKEKENENENEKEKEKEEKEKKEKEIYKEKEKYKEKKR